MPMSFEREVANCRLSSHPGVGDHVGVEDHDVVRSGRRPRCRGWRWRRTRRSSRRPRRGCPGSARSAATCSGPDASSATTISTSRDSVVRRRLATRARDLGGVAVAGDDDRHRATLPAIPAPCRPDRPIAAAALEPALQATLERREAQREGDDPVEDRAEAVVAVREHDPLAQGVARAVLGSDGRRDGRWLLLRHETHGMDPRANRVVRIHLCSGDLEPAPDWPRRESGRRSGRRRRLRAARSRARAGSRPTISR